MEGLQMEREFCKKCSRCRERAVVIATIPYEIQVDYDGRKYQVKIPEFSVPRCAKCGNISHDHEASEQISRAFRKQAGLLDSQAIRHHREELGIPQEELADMLGVTAAEVARWERGEQIQQRVADRFLRAFFDMPELRKMLAAARGREPSPIG
jgi:putative zinc finger/helix-turn-helix YgiT family protein